MTELVAGLRDSPMTAAIGCIAIIPIAVWVYSVVSWMIMGEMDFLFGVIAVLAALLLGMVAMMPSDPMFAPLALAGIVSLMIVFPVAKRQLDRRALVMIDVEQIEGAYEMLSLKPDNSNAMFKLAECLYHRGLLGHAVGIGERALANLPLDIFPEENRAVKKWKLQAKDPAHNRFLPCLECGRLNGPSVIVCEGCGANYLATYARGKWLGQTVALRLVASWVAAVVALVGIPVTLKSVDDTVAIVGLVTVQIVIVGFLVWRAFLFRGAKA